MELIEKYLLPPPKKSHPFRYANMDTVAELKTRLRLLGFQANDKGSMFYPGEQVDGNLILWESLFPENGTAVDLNLINRKGLPYERKI